MRICTLSAEAGRFQLNLGMQLISLQKLIGQFPSMLIMPQAGIGLLLEDLPTGGNQTRLFFRLRGRPFSFRTLTSASASHTLDM